MCVFRSRANGFLMKIFFTFRAKFKKALFFKFVFNTLLHFLKNENERGGGGGGGGGGGICLRGRVSPL